MSLQIALVVLLTFVVTLIGTLALGVRITALRTGKWAVAFSLFNIMTLVARLANTLQAPLLAKTIETNIHAGRLREAADFHWIILSTTLATGVGALLLPSFQRLLGRGVERYYTYRSIPRLLYRSLTWQTARQMKQYLKWPDAANFRVRNTVPVSILVMNVLTSAFLTVSVLATLYAGYINPELRSTSASMAGLINGLATLLLLFFVDPDMALLCDEVGTGRFSQGYFRRYVTYVIAARLAGTLLAQVLLVPAAKLVAWVAELIRV